QDALRRRDAEKPTELSPRIGDARRKADLVERVESFDVREGDRTQGGGLLLSGVRLGLGDWGTGGLGELAGASHLAGHLSFIARSASRLRSRSRIASRLSWSFLPLTSAISALTFEPLK